MRISIITLAAFLSAGTLAGRQVRPNILFIMTDDHATTAVGSYGKRFAPLDPTPTLDAFAKEGIRFANCFVTNSICVPSRASMLTGQYPQTNGVLDLDQVLTPDHHYLPKEMRKLGYQTALIGKWHLGTEPDFDYYKVMVAAGGQGTYFDPEFVKTGMEFGGLRQNPDLETIKTTGHSTDVITNLTIDWLDNQRDASRPFFLMHQYKAPHDMFEYAPRYEEYLADKDIPEPVSLYGQPFWGSDATRGHKDGLRHIIGTSISRRHNARNYVDEFVENPPRDDDAATSLAYQEYGRRYLRCVKGVDDNLARLFDHLKKTGLWKNTIIVYTSDQGMMVGEHDLQDKRWMYEESIHMPFIVRLPGDGPRGIVNDTMIANADFAPTLIELAGGTAPDYMQGRSFAPAIVTGALMKNWDDGIYYRYWMHMIHHDIPAHFGIRTPRYKLIFFYGYHYDEARMGTLIRSWASDQNRIGQTPAAWEFYDLERDPGEVVNRYRAPEYQDTIRGLKERLRAKREELGETDEDYPRIQAIIDEFWDA